MKILAIETSCDDTCVSIIKVKSQNDPRGTPVKSFDVLSNIVSSQIEVHKKYGGVYPTLAKREHQKNLTPVLTEALRKAKLLKIKNEKLKIKNDNAKFKIVKDILNRESELFKIILPFLKKHKKPDINLVAVTIGPGLEPCLWVGVNFAKALAYYWNLPIMPVNHIESHILVNFLNTKYSIPNTKNFFPAICLVVSGGHTQLILMEKIGKYKILGETRDDAAGECFDKCARILGLGYPGGPIISNLAEKNEKNSEKNRGRASILLPRPMINTNDYDFSFSGLKTAVLYEVQRKYGAALLRSAFSRTTEGRQYIKQMCAEIQQSVIDVLIKKTIKAAKDFKAKTIIVGGGVSANEELRKQLSQKIQKELPNTKYLIPDTVLSTDNALMVAITGYFKAKQNKFSKWQNIRADSNLRI